MNTAQDTRLLILKLLKEQGSNTSQMLTELEFNQSLILDMGRKDSMPAADKLGRIADYLHVSVDYLLGRDDIPNRKEAISSPAEENAPSHQKDPEVDTYDKTN